MVSFTACGNARESTKGRGKCSLICKLVDEGAIYPVHSCRRHGVCEGSVRAWGTVHTHSQKGNGPNCPLKPLEALVQHPCLESSLHPLGSVTVCIRCFGGVPLYFEFSLVGPLRGLGAGVQLSKG